MHSIHTLLKDLFETSRKASLSVSFSVLFRKRLQMNFIFSDNVCILYLSCNVNEPKITAKLSKKSIIKHPLNCF